MKITKYEHACLLIEEQGTRVIIDPGNFSPSISNDCDNIAAVVVTHVHADHFDPEKLQAILAKNPACQIFTTQEVANEFGQKATAVQAGQTVKLENIKLE